MTTEAEGMDNQNSEMLAIMFADVAGSTSLYDQVGDVEAERRISQMLSKMSRLCINQQGNIVKNIGDEILVSFKTADDAVLAANEIQLAINDGVIDNGGTLFVRIGMHYGPVIVKSNDVFGDTVNVAARMAGLAKAKQIICTAETIQGMTNPDAVSSRQLNPLYVKGKENMIDIVEVLWEPDDGELTCLFSSQQVLENKPEWVLELTYLNDVSQICKSKPSMVMGRGKQCDLVIHSPQASREHAKLVSRRGKVVLVDQSTNGTFIQNARGEEIFLHKEELPLSENGVISLGLPVAKNDGHLIYFKYD